MTQVPLIEQLNAVKDLEKRELLKADIWKRNKNTELHELILVEIFSLYQHALSMLTPPEATSDKRNFASGLLYGMSILADKANATLTEKYRESDDLDPYTQPEIDFIEKEDPVT